MPDKVGLGTVGKVLGNYPGKILKFEKIYILAQDMEVWNFSIFSVLPLWEWKGGELCSFIFDPESSEGAPYISGIRYPLYFPMHIFMSVEKW